MFSKITGLCWEWLLLPEMGWRLSELDLFQGHRLWLCSEGALGRHKLVLLRFKAGRGKDVVQRGEELRRKNTPSALS